MAIGVTWAGENLPVVVSVIIIITIFFTEHEREWERSIQQRAADYEQMGHKVPDSTRPFGPQSSSELRDRRASNANAPSGDLIVIGGKQYQLVELDEKAATQHDEIRYQLQEAECKEQPNDQGADKEAELHPSHTIGIKVVPELEPAGDVSASNPGDAQLEKCPAQAPDSPTSVNSSLASLEDRLDSLLVEMTLTKQQGVILEEDTSAIGEPLETEAPAQPSQPPETTPQVETATTTTTQDASEQVLLTATEAELIDRLPSILTKEQLEKAIPPEKSTEDQAPAESQHSPQEDALSEAEAAPEKPTVLVHSQELAPTSPPERVLASPCDSSPQHQPDTSDQVAAERDETTVEVGYDPGRFADADAADANIVQNTTTKTTTATTAVNASTRADQAPPPPPPALDLEPTVQQVESPVQGDTDAQEMPMGDETALDQRPRLEMNHPAPEAAHREAPNRRMSDSLEQMSPARIAHLINRFEALGAENEAEAQSRGEQGQGQAEVEVEVEVEVDDNRSLTTADSQFGSNDTTSWGCSSTDGSAGEILRGELSTKQKQCSRIGKKADPWFFSPHPPSSTKLENDHIATYCSIFRCQVPLPVRHIPRLCADIRRGVLVCFRRYRQRAKSSIDVSAYSSDIFSFLFFSFLMKK